MHVIYFTCNNWIAQKKLIVNSNYILRKALVICAMTSSCSMFWNHRCEQSTQTRGTKKKEQHEQYCQYLYTIFSTKTRSIELKKFSVLFEDFLENTLTMNLFHPKLNLTNAIAILALIEKIWLTFDVYESEHCRPLFWCFSHSKINTFPT